MSKNCPTCSAPICEDCGKQLTIVAGNAICQPCFVKELEEFELSPSCGYHDEVQLWDGMKWNLTKFSNRLASVWYAGDWRTNWKDNGERDAYGRNCLELTEVNS